MKFKINNNRNVDIEEWNKLLRIHVKRIPVCATFEQYKEWRLTAMNILPPAKSWFCTDCTPQFQKQMKSEGRCDHPYIRFEHYYDGIEGYIDSNDQDIHKDTIYKFV